MVKRASQTHTHTHFINLTHISAKVPKIARIGHDYSDNFVNISARFSNNYVRVHDILVISIIFLFRNSNPACPFVGCFVYFKSLDLNISSSHNVVLNTPVHSVCVQPSKWLESCLKLFHPQHLVLK